MSDKRGSGGGGRKPTDETTCEEALALVYEYLDGELEPERTDIVRRHLAQCRCCYPHFDFERMFLDYVRDVGGTPRSSPELRDRIRRILERESG
ncbi:MAG: zf-HC2 domain-containing protein [Gemmatimonadota bacterium]|nr:zf-HC2 domain-containing protein [Gemmatimonadota bacterium]